MSFWAGFGVILAYFVLPTPPLSAGAMVWMFGPLICGPERWIFRALSFLCCKLSLTTMRKVFSVSLGRALVTVNRGRVKIRVPSLPQTPSARTEHHKKTSNLSQQVSVTTRGRDTHVFRGYFSKWTPVSLCWLARTYMLTTPLDAETR